MLNKIIAFYVAALLTFSTSAGMTQTDPHGKWLLDGVPEISAGTYSTALYNTGTGVMQEKKWSDADPEPAPAYSFMQLVKDVFPADCAGYCRTLSSLGYRQTYSYRRDGNEYYAYQKGEKQIYFYYNGSAQEIRVIDDCVNSCGLDCFGYTSAKRVDGLEPTVYQYAYDYCDAGHPDSSVYQTCGMMYVILLSDGRVVIIDGGGALQTNSKALTQFRDLLYEITGTKTTKKLNIALWTGTHAHGDHQTFFYRFLDKYAKKLNVERVMFNFQSDDVIEKEKTYYNLIRYLDKNVPDAKYVKPRSGYSFTLQDARFEILYSHEDHINASDASWTFTNMNDACTVLKVTIGGRAFLFCGDINRTAEKTLLLNCSPATLRSDVLQAAHHLYNDLPALYRVAAPQYVMCPQSKLKSVTTPLPGYKTLIKYVPEDRFFFADQKIYGFTPKSDGTVGVTEIDRPGAAA